jgi:hypothetical protein
MNLAQMIQKRRMRQSANANSAKAANDRGLFRAPFAKIATFAFANPPEPKTSNPVQDAVADDKTAINRWWRIHYPNREPVEVVYGSPVTHAQILEWEPEAIKVESFEPIREKPEKPMSADEEAQIRQWLKHIGETDEDIIRDVIEQCNTDAKARCSYLGLAQEVIGEDEDY